MKVDVSAGVDDDGGQVSVALVMRIIRPRF